MFYEDLKRKIESLLTEQKHQEAIILIDNELKAPYIPQDFELFLHKSRNKAQSHLQQNQKVTTQVIGLEEIKSMLQTKDPAAHLIAIDAFDKINIRLLDQTINDFLLRRDVTNDVKSLVLIALNKQDLNQPFSVWHQSEIIEVNPKDLQVDKLATFNRQVVKKLETAFFRKNQSLNNLAIKIALLFLLDFFPKDFYFKPADVAAMSIKRAGKMLNETITWDQIHEAFPFDLKTATIIFGHQLASLD